MVVSEDSLQKCMAKIDGFCYALKIELSSGQIHDSRYAEGLLCGERATKKVPILTLLQKRILALGYVPVMLGKIIDLI